MEVAFTISPLCCQDQLFLPIEPCDVSGSVVGRQVTVVGGSQQEEEEEKEKEEEKEREEEEEKNLQIAIRCLWDLFD